MSLASLEREMLRALRIATGNKKLRLKDMIEWSTDETTVRKNLRQDEKIIELKDPHVWVAYKEA